MEISATFQGESIVVFDIGVNGGMYSMAYVDTSGNLKVSKRPIIPGVQDVTIATSATY